MVVRHRRKPKHRFRLSRSKRGRQRKTITFRRPFIKRRQLITVQFIPPDAFKSTDEAMSHTSVPILEGILKNLPKRTIFRNLSGGMTRLAREDDMMVVNGVSKVLEGSEFAGSKMIRIPVSTSGQ